MLIKGSCSSTVLGLVVVGPTVDVGDGGLLVVESVQCRDKVRDLLRYPDFGDRL